MRREFLILPLLCCLSGCTQYFKVTDPGGSEAYYTTKVTRNKDSGTVTLVDAKTGAEVTLQSSQVLKIDEEEYKAATAGSVSE